jgi:hypothetical protein
MVTCKVKINDCLHCPYHDGDGMMWRCNHPDSPVYQLRGLYRKRNHFAKDMWYIHYRRPLWCRLKEGEQVWLE